LLYGCKGTQQAEGIVREKGLEAGSAAGQRRPNAQTPSVPLLQDEPRDHPLCGDALHPLPLSLRKAEDLLHEREIDISNETVRA